MKKYKTIYNRNMRKGCFPEEKSYERETRLAERYAYLERQMFIRKLTDSEIRELRKLDLYAKTEPYIADIFREMAEESEKYPQYIKDVPEWAQN